MTIKKKIKSRFLLALRKYGMLCKKLVKTTRYIKVSKTIFPDGTEMKHNRITSVPENKNDFESQVHVFNEIKNLVSK
jgi:thiamine kinase-like enzyme